MMEVGNGLVVEVNNMKLFKRIIAKLFGIKQCQCKGK